MKRFELAAWDLMHLIPSTIEKKRREIEKKTEAFEDKRELLNPNIRKKDFLALLGDYAYISEDLEKIVAASYLKFAEDTSNKAADSTYFDIKNFNARIRNRLLFFELWLRKGLGENNFKRLAKSSGEYEPALREERRFKWFALENNIEKVLNYNKVTGCLERLDFYDKIISDFHYKMHVKKGVRRTLNESELRPFLSHPRSNRREEAYKELLARFAENKHQLGEIYMAQVLDWYNEFVLLRGYESPIKARNHQNNLSDEAIDALLEVCEENVGIFQEYFQLKKKISKIRGKLSRTDIYAPPKEANGAKVSFTKGMNLVLEAFQAFSPEWSKLILDMEKHRYIHSKPQENKWPGTFAYSTPPSILPYVLINFSQHEQDVILLGHEFGHAIHNQLSSLENNVLTYDTSEPIAEIASIFSEMLVYDKLLEQAADNPVKKKKYMVSFLDNAYSCTLSKAYFVLFEKEAHKMITSPKSTNVEELSKMYYRKLREQFGKGMSIPENFKYEWLQEYNLFDAPFQSYAYPFGYIIALSLHEQYKKNGAEFKRKFKDFLSSSSYSGEHYLKELGIDIRSKEFWQHGFDLVKEKVEELKKLVE